MTTITLNTSLLLDVAKTFEEHPRLHGQAEWAELSEGSLARLDPESVTAPPVEVFEDCGTAFCIGGTGAVLSESPDIAWKRTTREFGGQPFVTAVYPEPVGDRGLVAEWLRAAGGRAALRSSLWVTVERPGSLSLWLGPLDVAWAQAIGVRQFGLDPIDSTLLFHSQWKPRPGLTVADALRDLAAGVPLEEVSA